MNNKQTPPAATELFTPGPWRLQGPKIQEDFGNQTYYAILPDPFKSPADPYKAIGFYYPYSGLTNAEIVDNAALIAAAPDLYYALKDLVKWAVLNTDSFPPELIAAKAAIQKANPNYKP